MDKEKEKQEISLIGRIFSLEALLIVMGLLSLASGLFYSDGTRVFLGIAAIICGSLLILVVRKKYLEKR
jgi:hypothetical protein